MYDDRPESDWLLRLRRLLHNLSRKLHSLCFPSLIFAQDGYEAVDLKLKREDTAIMVLAGQQHKGTL